MNKKSGFTFVELIVVVTILWILSTIWFISYTSSLWDARDGTRTSDIAAISSALKQYKQSRWNYPIPSPGGNFILNVWSATGAIQWTLNNFVTLSTLDDVPQDPLVQANYTYSVTPNRQQYQVAATLENSDTPLSILKWDYTSVSRYELPTIIIATWSTTSIDVTSGTNENLFVFDNQIHNLVYDFTWDNTPVSDNTTLISLLIEAESDWSWWQNSDFQSCNEIEEAWKDIWTLACSSPPFDCYQIVDSSLWTLSNVSCTIIP